jgi:hypothetical protein
MEGVYPVKLRALTIFDLDTKDMEGYSSILAELTESKPDYLKIDPELEQIKAGRFGCFKVGNTEQKVWFLITKSRQEFWDELYIDQNADNRIAVNEKVRGILPGYGKSGKNEFLAATTNIAVPIRVSFKGSKSDFQKKQYFFIQMKTFYKKVELDTIVVMFSSSFLDGEMKVLIGKAVKVVKFRIYDWNGNGCFNDFGNDRIFIDKDADGYLTAKEGWPLSEYFTATGPDGQKKLRIVVPPHPAKIAVVGVSDSVDWSQLEPAGDPKDE